MLYKHKLFTLNIKTKNVFDKNNKELRLTGNSYRLLVLLCQNGAANIKEIGEYLDDKKDYDANHIRQYRYKINSIIGDNLVKYRNTVYYINGKVDEVSSEEDIKLAKNDRNTVFLHTNTVELNKNNNLFVDKSKVPAFISILFLAFSFFHWPYGYYTLMRLIVSLSAVYYAYNIYQKKHKINLWFWGLIGVALLFNPVFPVYFYDRLIWGIIDILIIIFLISFLKYAKI